MLCNKIFQQEQIHKALASVARDCKNFKVRINAAMAFSVPTKRECYGSTEQYAEIWDSLISGLQGAETITDFSEYKYKDNLLEQVILTASTVYIRRYTKYKKIQNSAE